MKKLFCVVAVFIIILQVSVYAENSNLVLNPGFEEKEASSPYYWTTYSWENNGEFQIDTSQAYSGNSSALIVNEAATDSRYKQKILIKSNTQYRLSCWIKTENVDSNAKGANLSIEGLTETSPDVKGTTDWSYVELYGISGQNQSDLTVTLGLGGYGSLNTGRAWFDDVKIEETDTVPEGASLIKLYREDAAAAASKASATGSNSFMIFFTVILALLVIIFTPLFLKRKKNVTIDSTADGKVLQSVYRKVHIDKKDCIILISLALIYLGIALPNLGGLKTPVTSWTPSSQGENLLIDLGKQADISRIYFYGGLGQNRPDQGTYRVLYMDESGEYKALCTLEKSDKNIFVWSFAKVSNISTRFIKLIVDQPGGTLNEIAVIESNTTVPLQGLKILEKNVNVNDDGKVENLFDEYNTVEYKHTFMSGMIFDEIYHARTAYEFLHHQEPYEWTHPPLGKVLISLGILIFGMNPFGWRIIGVLFGMALIPIMYLFGKKIMGNRFFAFCTAFLMMFDFMLFSMSRIATVDIFGTFFVVLMYYFIYDYFINKSYLTSFKQSMIPLFLSGCCFGLGIACKWIGLYAGGGLAIVFFLSKYLEFKDYRNISGSKIKKTPWYNDFIPVYIVRTFLYCLLFFVIIPLSIYILSYIPFILVPKDGYNASIILKNQIDMLTYHGKTVLAATHPYSSYWYEWPLVLKPILTYQGSDLPAGMSSTMVIMGNPAIWWVGTIAIAAAIIISIRKKDKTMIPIFAAIAFQYLPWVGITRITFIYHFFSVVPFMILSIVYVMKYLLEYNTKTKSVIYSYLFVVLLLFVLFYPVLSGIPVERDYVDKYLIWLKGKWLF